jgi:hypothetical protein
MYAVATRRQQIQCSCDSAHISVSQDHISSSFADLMIMGVSCEEVSLYKAAQYKNWSEQARRIV